jgi:virginiamycin B lyase
MTSSRTGRPWGLAGAFCLVIALFHVPLPAAGAPRGFEPSPKVHLGQGTRATALTTGPDGNLWFAGPKYDAGAGTVNVVGRVTSAGQVTEFPLPPSHLRFPVLPAIATGADGSLWFTELGANAIGRVTTAGLITEFPLPPGGSEPSVIVAGPEGALWFTEENASRVGRVDPTGQITEFALPMGAGPGGIAMGPDGNLWVTERNLGRIARLTPNGSVTEFPLPDPASLPGAIVAGPDGNLWFTEEAAPRIGRIAPSGEMVEFPVPVRQGTRKISPGPDGNLWFTVGNRIGSISPSGATGQLSCVGPDLCRYPVASLAVGPDGGLWFGTGVQGTEGGGGTFLQALYFSSGVVGRFTPAPVTARIGSHAGLVSKTRTSLDLACTGGTAGAACTGRIRLLGPAPRRFVLAQRRYRLVVSSRHRFGLPLTRRAKRLLSHRGRLGATAEVTVSGGEGVSRRIGIRASFQRP